MGLHDRNYGPSICRQDGRLYSCCPLGRLHMEGVEHDWLIDEL